MKNTSDMFNFKFDPDHNQTWDDFLKMQAAMFVDDEINILKSFGFSNKKSPVLDLGCGSGHFSLQLLKRFKQLKCICAETNTELYKALNDNIKKNKTSRISTIQWSAGHQTPPKIVKQANSVIIRMVLQHTLNPLKILKDLNKSLKKNIDIYIIEDDLSFYQFHPPLKAFDRFIKTIHKYCTSQKSNVYIGKQIPNIAHKAGLKVINTRLLSHSNHNIGSDYLMDFFRMGLLLCAKTSKGIISEKEAYKLIKECDKYLDIHQNGCFFFHPFIVTHVRS
jgi:ubiquinone/menaquinone biosynthesis C-methylase UbiE